MKKIFILLILFLSLSLVHAQSIWQQVNPMPPLVDFNDVHFINTQEGWACGDDGVLIHTLDGAQTWSQVNTLFDSFISGVWFVDSLTGYICGEEVLKTEDGGNNWERIYGHNQSDYYFSVYFENQDTGWVTTQSGKLIKTIDGGSTWMAYQTPESWIQQMVPINEQTLWARSRYKLMVSYNGGTDWEIKLAYSYDKYINDFYFLNDTLGWAVGDFPMMRTNDGGVTWDTVFTLDPGSAYAVRFYNVDTGFVYRGSYCYKTEDGGETWEEVINYPYTSDVFDVTRPFEDFICLTASNGVYFSNDLGENWQEVNGGAIHDYNAVDATIPERVFAVGEDGVLSYTTDDGASWDFYDLGMNADLNDLFFQDEQNGWIVGDNGFVAFTNNGGLTWENTFMLTNQDLTAIRFAGDQWGMIVGTGVAFKSVNGGASWTNASVPASAWLRDVALLSDGVVFCVGNDGVIIRSMDGGNTWEQIESGTDWDLLDVCFVDEDFGWIAGNRVILSTTDGGNTWNVQWESIQYNKGVFTIEFEDQLHGWACGRRGDAYHTKDGGNTWVPQPLALEKDIFDLEIRGEKAFCVGETGVIHKTHYIHYLAPGIVDQTPDTAFCEGKANEFLVEAVGDSLNFQWYKSDVPIEGATNASYIIDPTGIFDGGIYYCEAFNGAGLMRGDDIMMSVKPKAMVVFGPDDISAFDGDTVIFNQSVVGALPINYQWQKDGVDIPGAVFHTYTIYGVGPDDIGDYRCIVSNECNTDTSATAKLEVSPGPGVAEDLLLPFSIYPNPANDFIQIHFDQTQEATAFAIFNLNGKAIVSEVVKNENSVRISLDALSKGVYVLKVTVSGQVYFTKFVKQ